MKCETALSLRRSTTTRVMASETKQSYSDSDSDSYTALETARSSPLPQIPLPSNPSRPVSTLQTSTSYADDAIFDFEPPSESQYPPAPIKSANASREAQFEQDTDELLPEDEVGEDAVLMEGLIQSSRRRGSVDLGNHPPELPRPEKGSGILAGIANMSNSILGAGIIGQSTSTHSVRGTKGKLLTIFDSQVCRLRLGKLDSCVVSFYSSRWGWSRISHCVSSFSTPK